jgi:hypothetical protein
VFPKIFRRITEYLRTGQTGAKGFLPWLAVSKEQVLDLTTKEFTHFDNVMTTSRG